MSYPMNLEALKDLNARYVRQRDNLNRIIAENQARIAEFSRPVVQEGDIVNVDYVKLNGAFENYVAVEVVKLDRRHMLISWDEDEAPEYRTLLLSGITAVERHEDEATLRLPSDPSGAVGPSDPSVPAGVGGSDPSGAVVARVEAYHGR